MKFIILFFTLVFSCISYSQDTSNLKYSLDVSNAIPLTIYEYPKDSIIYKNDSKFVYIINKKSNLCLDSLIISYHSNGKI